MAIMATLATTAAPAFSRIGEGAKAKQTRANLEKITKNMISKLKNQYKIIA